MAFSFVPSGTILPFGGATAPSGWLLCDGSAVSQTAYPALSTAIGVLWGNPGGGSFNLPDLRGAFVRGTGTSGVHVGPSTVGAVQTHATAKNGLTASAAASAVTGSAAAHTFSGSTGSSNVPSNNVSGPDNATGLSGSANSAVNPQNNSGTHSHSFSGSTSGGSISGTAAAQVITIGAGDSETRPNSKGVNYIIKI